MKIAILGHGKEGKSAEAYFRAKGFSPTVIDNFTEEDLDRTDFTNYDLVFRSPSVRPRPNWSSMTQYFFEHCPCPIVGVTGTKGKGTTSTLITAILEKLGYKVWLVGNIGNPALDVLDNIQGSDVVVYEMSSFQLWDLTKSPHVAVVLGIEPDHLNVHKDFEEYVDAKANIARHQSPEDYCIYYSSNQRSCDITKTSSGHKISYPIPKNKELESLLDQLNIPGWHNRDNAQAALLAVSAYLGIELSALLNRHSAEISEVFQSFQGLPHRLQFLRKLKNAKYYDDNFATNPTSTKVALEAFPDTPLVLIAGGRDKTDYRDLPELVDILQNTPNLQKIILIGESGHELAKILPKESFVVAENLESAVTEARRHAEANDSDTIVLMSPAAASFDMFENVYDRGAQFQRLIQELA